VTEGAIGTLRHNPDVEVQLLPGGQLGEAAIAAVGDDRLHVGQLIEALIEQLPSSADSKSGLI
jgi:hypothetical protein